MQGELRRPASCVRLVSIVIPVRNCREHVEEAVSSILGQTYTRLQVLVVDDASDDGTADVIESIRDERLVKLRLRKKARGIPRSYGLGRAKGDYIGLMDADDVSHPCRIEKQVRFLERDPEVDVVGTAWEPFSTTVTVPAGKKRPGILVSENRGDYRDRLLRGWSVVATPTVLCRRRVFESVGFQPYRCGEDFAFWLKVSREFTIRNLPDVLFHRRLRGGSASRRYWVEGRVRTYRSLLEELGWCLSRGRTRDAALILRTAPRSLAGSLKRICLTWGLEV